MSEMGKARQILAVTLVATALCADRAVAAEPSSRGAAGDGVISIAGRLVTRLSSNFRRVVPAIRLRPSRSSQVARSIVMPAPIIAVVAPRQLTPFQFRLPPPIV